MEGRYIYIHWSWRPSGPCQKERSENQPPPSEVLNGDPPRDIRTSRKIPQDGNVSLPGRHPEAAGNEGRSPFRKACLRSGLSDKGQAVRCREAGHGCRVPDIGWEITSRGTGRILGYPATRVIISRNHVLFGHQGAMRRMVARSCLTLYRIRGMREIGGKAYPLNPSHRNEKASIRHTAESRAFVQYLRSWAWVPTQTDPRVGDRMFGESRPWPGGGGSTPRGEHGRGTENLRLNCLGRGCKRQSG